MLRPRDYLATSRPSVSLYKYIFRVIYIHGTEPVEYVSRGGSQRSIIISLAVTKRGFTRLPGKLKIKMIPDGKRITCLC